MELFIIITVQSGIEGHGTNIATVKHRVTIDLPVTREAIFEWVLTQLPDDLKGSPVLFFSAEPNLLATETPSRQNVVTS